MKRRFCSLMWLVIIVLLTCVTDSVEAQSALVIVVVTDVDGKPVDGATVTVSNPDNESYRDTKTTSKKGKVKFSHNDSQPTYFYEIEMKGYQTQTAEVHSEYSETARLEVVLLPVKEGQVSGQEFQQALVKSQAYEVFNEGVAAQELGDLNFAEAKFREAAEIDPSLIEPHLALAVVAHQREDYESAVTEAELALAIDPASEQGLLLRYDSYRNLGDADRTAEAAQALRGTDRVTDAAASVFNEGLDQYKSGNLDEAVVIFTQAIDLDPKLVSGFVMLGSIAISQGQFEQAAAMSLKATEIDPKSSNALKVRYDAMRNLGDAEGSREALKGLIEVDPEWVGSQLAQHATELYNAGQMDDAAIAFAAVVEVQPDHVKALFLLGMAEYNLGNTANAKKHLTRFLELAPDDPDAVIVKEILQFAAQ